MYIIKTEIREHHISGHKQEGILFHVSVGITMKL